MTGLARKLVGSIRKPVSPTRDPADPYPGPVARSSEPARQRIIEVAERLFAERGIEGPTLREIGVAAQQRNNSAVQYHFGDRMGLLAAVLTPHLDQLDRERERTLRELDAAGAASLDALVGVLVRPLAAKLAEPSGVRYLQIQAALLGTGPNQSLAPDTLRPWGRPAVRSLVQRIGLLVEPVDAAEGEARRLLVVTMVFNGLANFASAHAPADGPECELLVRTLCDSISAVLLRPSVVAPGLAP